MKYPLVTVNILSYNRKEELRNTLTKVFEQDYKNIEVIVTDNASSDGSPEMVKREFPQVKLIELEKNIGIAGWNKGFEAARGEYVLVLDDDSYPEKKAISNGIKILISDPQIGIIACYIRQSFSDKKNSDLEFTKNTLSFVGCGAIIRTRVIQEVGGFNKILFLYFHEVDFSIRVINAGWKIIYYQQCEVIHLSSDKNRTIVGDIDERKLFYDIRNHLLILFTYFPYKKTLIILPRIILGRIYWGLLKSKTKIVINALIAALKIFFQKKLKKQKINQETLEKYKFGRFSGGFFFHYNNYGLERPRWLKKRK